MKDQRLTSHLSKVLLEVLLHRFLLRAGCPDRKVTLVRKVLLVQLVQLDQRAIRETEDYRVSKV